jgi:hypothetical protein
MQLDKYQQHTPMTQHNIELSIIRPVLQRPPGEGPESRPGRFSPSDC